MISRPLFWSWTGLAYLAGLGSFSNFNLVAIAELILFLFPLNFLLYGINDVYDRESDKRNPRKGGLQGVVLAEREFVAVKKISLAVATLFLAISVSSLNIGHFVLSVLFVAASFIYSHGYFRFKEIPFIDSILSAVIYLLPIAIAYSLHEPIGDVPYKFFILGAPLVGAHAITALVDSDADKAARMRTTGIFLGERKTIIFSLLTFVVPLLFFYSHHFLATILGINIFWLIMFCFFPEKLRLSLLVSLSLIQITSYMTVLLYFILGANGFN